MCEACTLVNGVCVSEVLESLHGVIILVWSDAACILCVAQMGKTQDVGVCTSALIFRLQNVIPSLSKIHSPAV